MAGVWVGAGAAALHVQELATAAGGAAPECPGCPLAVRDKANAPRCAPLLRCQEQTRNAPNGDGAAPPAQSKGPSGRTGLDDFEKKERGPVATLRQAGGGTEGTGEAAREAAREA